ncbi:MULTISPECIES: SagB/ThcOx family dehydrogenase [Bacillus]|uniref:SagB/ThcOx family dehydrogenase n=1 Tax=Bacillus TaxID=1386 RepID=UPI00031FAF7C|nr:MULTISPECIES: SagB family peptide dehydrogenase [Bacillus]
MNLDTFLYNLHFDIEKASPPDWTVDWEDAPLSYKLYRDLPVFSFSLETPLTLEWQLPSKPDFERMGHFLWYVFGLTQFSQIVYPSDSSEQTVYTMQTFRRFVPSGGALYPNELYIYLKLEHLPDGVYHYDVAHHRLVLLREGNFDSYIAQSLGNRCEISTCFGVVFISSMFWKNFFKYHNFSYRLQGLDTGVLLGQLLEIAKRFGFASSVYYQFLDRAVNHLFGLSEREESIYAIVPLSVEPTSWFTNVSDKDGVVCDVDLCRELEKIQCNHYVRSLYVKEFPMLRKMNETSMMESTEMFRWDNSNKSKGEELQKIDLPFIENLSYDLSTICKNRFSPEMDFILGKVTLLQLATLLQEATVSFPYRNDLDRGECIEESRISIYGCFYNVEGIAPGAYSYDSKSHSLYQINPGDHRLKLQYAMSLDNVNLQQVPLCFHIVGNKNSWKTELGYRGYRIQQMEAGMLVQRLLLAATALGMGGHPLLGYDVNQCDVIYKIKMDRKTSLIQVPIGFYRHRPWLKGSLQS